MLNVLHELRGRFDRALPDIDDSLRLELLAMIRPSAEARFGDYQANFAMPLGKRLGRPPRDVAAEVVARLKIDDLCEPPEIAGPGFINLRIRSDWLAQRLRAASLDHRLGVARTTVQRTFVLDYSSPNVAKPMHVGHIRSTIIGAALDRTLRFLGHRVISDNHIGDWGTQFGMIIYGYKSFLDQDAYKHSPVAELGRLYRLVNTLVDYHASRAALEGAQRKVAEREAEFARLAAAPRQSSAAPTSTSAAAADKSTKADKAAKDAAKLLRRAETQLAEAREELAGLQRRLAAVETDPQLGPLARQHADIGQRVLAETAKLHAGDAENLALWRAFMPPCLGEIERIYRRLGVSFDHTLGESYYHDALEKTVNELVAWGLARESDGALCVFLPGHEAPLIVRKQDGAFLYATTDLATIEYRVRHWKPDAILYVVDHRQSLHFEQLFATARQWGFDRTEFAHVSFGTILGEDGRPFKTRAGDTVGLDSLLDEAVERALAIVSANDDARPEPELSAEQRQAVAEAVGVGAIKYADLVQNRTSDYVFSYDRMLAMNGNTATYMQYAHARVLSIFTRGNIDPGALRRSDAKVLLDSPAERALGLALAQFSEALDQMIQDYRPNMLTGYLYELAGRYSTFFESCPVLKAASDELRASRLLLCDLTARTLRQGLWLLGIDVVEKM